MTGWRRPGLAAAALLAVAACGTPAPAPVVLPFAPSNPLADQARQAVGATAFGFAHMADLAGKPAEAAALLGQAEYLTVALAADQRWAGLAPRVQQAFAAARPEWRRAAGIAEGAAPQAVIDALFAARDGLVGSDRAAVAAALTPPVFPEGAESVLARLAALPPLPLAAAAANEAQLEMWRDEVTVEPE